MELKQNPFIRFWVLPFLCCFWLSPSLAQQKNAIVIEVSTAFPEKQLEMANVIPIDVCRQSAIEALISIADKENLSQNFWPVSNSGESILVELIAQNDILEECLSLFIRAVGFEPVIVFRPHFYGRKQPIQVELIPLNLNENETNTLVDEWLKRKVAFPENQFKEESAMRSQWTDSCNYPIPATVFVENLRNGYNSTNCNCPTGNCFTGVIDFTEYIAGVITAEMGASFNEEALKAQAVAARTYSARRVQLGFPANCGQAYQAAIPVKCLQAAAATKDHILLFNGNAVITNYSARCDGSHTQNSEEGNWAGSGCALSGNVIAFQRSRPCSGHVNCSQLNEPYCCSLLTPSAGTIRHIYGHGVGLCQRGAFDFGRPDGNFRLLWSEILRRYYTGISIANNCLPAPVVVDTSENKPSIFPNPQKTGFPINVFWHGEHILEIIFFKPDGKKLRPQLFPLKEPIVAPESGFYLIELKTASGKRHFEKLIVY